MLTLVIVNIEFNCPLIGYCLLGVFTNYFVLVKSTNFVQIFFWWGQGDGVGIKRCLESHNFLGGQKQL